jgi:purine-binding chemotaxis protein CheW
MDIAEIRKKTRGRSKGPAAVPASQAMPTSAEPGDAAPAVAPGGTPPATAAAAADSGLDRLFAGASVGRFVAEDAYQSALVAQDQRNDAGFLECLAFRLGPEEYALDITRISEIIKPRECTNIPRVPDFILGLISLRGVVVPLIDLRQRFKLGTGQIGAASRIVVCREGEVTAGLLVDSITQVLRLPSDLIEPPPAVLSGIDRQLLDGVGRYQGRMVILLNLATVLDVGVE